MTLRGNARLKVMVALAVVIGGYVVATSGDDAGVEPAQRPRAAAGAAARSAAAADGAVVGPAAGALLARLGRRVSDGAASDALFARHSWYVAPPAPPPAPVVAAPPPVPTAPPLPFGIMGSYARPGDATVYFLTRQDRVFDVHVGDTIDGTYKVASAGNGQLVLTYLPLDIQQTLAIGGAP
jgi:hypothetical protein